MGHTSHTHIYAHVRRVNMRLQGSLSAQSEWILKKCTELCTGLASSQLALGRDTGATLDHHPTRTTPPMHIALQLELTSTTGAVG